MISDLLGLPKGNVRMVINSLARNHARLRTWGLGNTSQQREWTGLISRPSDDGRSLAPRVTLRNGDTIQAHTMRHKDI